MPTYLSLLRAPTGLTSWVCLPFQGAQGHADAQQRMEACKNKGSREVSKGVRQTMSQWFSAHPGTWPETLARPSATWSWCVTWRSSGLTGAQIRKYYDSLLVSRKVTNFQRVNGSYGWTWTTDPSIMNGTIGLYLVVLLCINRGVRCSNCTTMHNWIP